MNKEKLSEYCKRRKINMYDLADITGICHTQLYKIDNDPMFNVRISTIQKIYNATGIKAGQYLDWDILDD